VLARRRLNPREAWNCCCLRSDRKKRCSLSERNLQASRCRRERRYSREARPMCFRGTCWSNRADCCSHKGARAASTGRPCRVRPALKRRTPPIQDRFCSRSRQSPQRPVPMRRADICRCPCPTERDASGGLALQDYGQSRRAAFVHDGEKRTQASLASDHSPTESPLRHFRKIPAAEISVSPKRN